MIITPYMQRLERAKHIPTSMIRAIDPYRWWVPDSATIQNPARNLGYLVEVEAGRLYCQCPDYHDQHRIGRGIPVDPAGYRTCKHIEAVKQKVATLVV